MDLPRTWPQRGQQQKSLKAQLKVHRYRGWVLWHRWWPIDDRSGIPFLSGLLRSFQLLFGVLAEGLLLNCTSLVGHRYLLLLVCNTAVETHHQLPCVSLTLCIEDDISSSFPQPLPMISEFFFCRRIFLHPNQQSVCAVWRIFASANFFVVLKYLYSVSNTWLLITDTGYLHRYFLFDRAKTGVSRSSSAATSSWTKPTVCCRMTSWHSSARSQW